MIIKIGSPPFPAAQTEFRYIAKIEHVWHSARRWAKRNGYEYENSFGVIGIAPTRGYSIATWFKLLKVPHRGTIDLYQLDRTGSPWIVEWRMFIIYG